MNNAEAGGRINMHASRECNSRYKKSGVAVIAAVPWCGLGNKMIVRVNLACNVDAFRRGWKWRNREAAIFRRGHLKNRAHCLKRWYLGGGISAL